MNNREHLSLSLFISGCLRYSSSPASISENGREEKAWDVLLLPFKNNIAIFACLCLAPHQIEELFKAHQIIVKWLGLLGHCNAFSTGRPTTAQVTLVGVVLTWVRLNLDNQVVHLVLMLMVLSVFGANLVQLLRGRRCHARLHDVFISEKWQRAQLPRSNGLRRVRRHVSSSAEEYPAAFRRVNLIRAQLKETLADANHLLKRAVAAHVFIIAEGWVLLFELIEQFLFIIGFLTWCLSHSLLDFFR